jgi:hypothetical protein
MNKKDIVVMDFSKGILIFDQAIKEIDNMVPSYY